MWIGNGQRYENVTPLERARILGTFKSLKHYKVVLSVDLGWPYDHSKQFVWGF